MDTPIVISHEDLVKTQLVLFLIASEFERRAILEKKAAPKEAQETRLTSNRTQSPLLSDRAFEKAICESAARALGVFAIDSEGFGGEPARVYLAKRGSVSAQIKDASGPVVRRAVISPKDLGIANRLLSLAAIQLGRQARDEEENTAGLTNRPQLGAERFEFRLRDGWEVEQNICTIAMQVLGDFAARSQIGAGPATHASRPGDLPARNPVVVVSADFTKTGAVAPRTSSTPNAGGPK